jgi:hypothetical protein
MNPSIQPIVLYANWQIKHVPEINQQNIVSAKVHNANYRSIWINSFRTSSISAASAFKGLFPIASAKSNHYRAELDLNFMRHRQSLNYGDLTKIAATLALKFPSLKRLKLVFDDPDHKISAADAKILALVIKRMKHLQKLTLVFMDEIGTSEYVVAKLISANMPTRELQEFNLILGDDLNFGQLAWANLACSLKNKVNLTRLTLLMENAMTQQHLLTLALALARLPKLTFLELGLSFNWGYHGIAELSDSLTHLANLRQLKLDFLSNEWCDTKTMKITDKELVQLATAIGNLAQLSCLNLKFMPGYKLTNLSMESLGTNLAKLANLTKVNLTFDSGDLGEGSKNISAAGIKLLMNGLYPHANLTTLTICLRGVIGLAPITYHYLANANPNLITYSLQLHSFSFSDNCCAALAAGLGELSHLKHLELKVVTAQELALDGLINLINSLDKIHALQTIDIMLIATEQPQKDVIDIQLLQATVEQRRNTLPNLQRFKLHLVPGMYNIENYCTIEVMRSSISNQWQTNISGYL